MSTTTVTRVWYKNDTERRQSWVEIANAHDPDEALATFWLLFDETKAAQIDVMKVERNVLPGGPKPPVQMDADGEDAGAPGALFADPEDFRDLEDGEWWKNGGKNPYR